MIDVPAAPQTLRDSLVRVADAYCEVRKLSRARVSTIVFSGGRVLDRLASGEADLKTVNFEKAMLWFSRNWPGDLAWPQDVPRPVVPDEALVPVSSPEEVV